MNRKVILRILVIGAIITNFLLGIGITNKVFAEDLTETTESQESVTQESTVQDEDTTQNQDTEVEPITPVVPEKKSITQLTSILNTSVHTYTGGETKISVKLYDGSKKLKQYVDYKITYKNAVNPGKATVIVDGIGGYTGTITKTFYIAPKKAKIKSVTFTNSTYTRAEIKWEKDNLANGYRIYMSNSKNGTYEYIKTITNKNTTSFTKKGLDPAKEYYFKIRAYKEVDGKKICKPYSDAKTAGKLLAKVTLTAHGSGANRKFNLKKASDTITGLVLKPGETFNWFRVVGPASKARGYKEASVFKNGKTVPGYGGGVCQVSSTLYQASVKAGLKIVERHIHSKPVTYTKLGTDATVSYGVQNLRIKNNKSYSIKIITSATGESTTCKIYSLAN